MPGWGLVALHRPLETGHYDPKLSTLRKLAKARVAMSDFCCGSLAANLVRAKVDVIVTTSPRETLAAGRATSSIPIVFTIIPDPLGLLSINGVFILDLSVGGSLIGGWVVLRLWQTHWRFELSPTRLLAVDWLRRKRKEVPWESVWKSAASRGPGGARAGTASR